MRFEAVWKLKTNIKTSILFITNIWITYLGCGRLSGGEGGAQKTIK